MEYIDGEDLASVRVEQPRTEQEHDPWK